ILDEVYTSGQAYVTTDAQAELEVDGILSSYYFDFTYKPLRNTAGEIYAILNMAVDVTEQVVSKQQLKASESRFRQAIEQAPVAILILKGENLVLETAN